MAEGRTGFHSGDAESVHSDSSHDVPSRHQTEACVIFIDDSNIFIEGLKYSAKLQSLKIEQDPTFRIDVEKLLILLRHGRVFDKENSRLFASETSHIGQVWHEISEHIKVDLFKRSETTGFEKQVDGALIAKSVWYACKNERKRSDTTIIILTGDSDMLPAVKLMIDDGWNVEVVAFASAIHAKWRKEDSELNKSHLKIIELDALIDLQDVRDWAERKWKPMKEKEFRQIPREVTTMIFHFKNKFDKNESDAKKLRKFAEDVIGLLKYPCFYYCHPPGDQQSMQESSEVLLIFADKVDKKLNSEFEKARFTNEETLPELIKCHGCTEYTDAKKLFEQLEKNLKPYQLAIKANFFSHIPPQAVKECLWGFNCTEGTDCEDQHSKKESEYFNSKKKRGPRKNYYKRYPCDYGNNCDKKSEKDTHLCKGYHSKKDAWCYICSKDGHGIKGHSEDCLIQCHSGLCKCT